MINYLAELDVHFHWNVDFVNSCDEGYSYIDSHMLIH